MLRKFSFN